MNEINKEDDKEMKEFFQTLSKDELIGICNNLYHDNKRLREELDAEKGNIR